MNLRELYENLEKILPPLSIEGIDSDGIHLMPDPDREVKRVLVALARRKPCGVHCYRK